MSAPQGVYFHRNRFLARVELPKDPITGKRNRKSFTAPPCGAHDGVAVETCRACQHLARDLRAEKLSELAGNTYVEDSRITLGEYLDRWLDVHAPKRRRSTIRNYRIKVETTIKPRIGHLPLQQVDGALLEGFYARLVTGDDLRPQGYAHASVRQVHAILRRALKDAVRPRGQYLLYNPAAELELPGREDGGEDVVSLLHVWSASELRTFLASLDGHANRTFYYLAAVTGMRRSELCGLRWDMVSLDRGIVRVERARHEVDGEVVWSAPKSRRSRRTIELSPTQVAPLREHRRAQAEQRLKMGAAWADHDLVFCAEDGTPPRPDHYTREFPRLVAAAGLPEIRLHDLRHTHATLLLEVGRPVKEVSERLGHATTAFTQDVYMHVTDTMRSATASALDEILEG